MVEVRYDDWHVSAHKILILKIHTSLLFKELKKKGNVKSCKL